MSQFISVKVLGAQWERYFDVWLAEYSQFLFYLLYYSSLSLMYHVFYDALLIINH